MSTTTFPLPLQALVSTLPPVDWPDWVGGSVGVLGLALAALGELRAWRAGRRAEDAENWAAAREYEATAREQEAALAYKDWIILYEFSPIVADQPETRAPILIRPERLTIWVHEVRFSWRPSDASEWTTHEARCEPWTPEVTLPVQLFPHRAGLSLAWPGPKPTEKAEQLTFTIRVHYSVSQDGPRWWRECDGGIWSWQ